MHSLYKYTWVKWFIKECLECREDIHIAKHCSLSVIITSSGMLDCRKNLTMSPSMGRAMVGEPQELVWGSLGVPQLLPLEGIYPLPCISKALSVPF